MRCILVRSPGKATLLTTLAFVSSACSGSLPSDNQLLARFEANRSGYEELVEMMQADDMRKLELSPRLFVRRGSKDDELPAERLHHYRLLFQRLGVRSAWRSVTPRPYSEQVEFIISEVHVAGQYWTGKGLMYLRRTALGADPTAILSGPVVDSLDGRSRREGLAYRQIDDHWYMVFWAM